MGGVEGLFSESHGLRSISSIFVLIIRTSSRFSGDVARKTDFAAGIIAQYMSPAVPSKLQRSAAEKQAVVVQRALLFIGSRALTCGFSPP